MFIFHPDTLFIATYTYKLIQIDVFGLCIDGKLNFDEHVRCVCSKAGAQIFALQCYNVSKDSDSNFTEVCSRLRVQLKIYQHWIR